MKKIIVPILLFVFIGCTEQKKAAPGSESPELTKDTSGATTNGKDMPVTVTLTENELKDDSVFINGSIPTSWENAGITDVKGLKTFLKQVQNWIVSNDREKIVAAVRYPLKDIKTEQEMLAAYDRIFTKDVLLSFATINFNQIFRNQKGVMLDFGKVWITQSGNEFFIYAIN